jgi:hypothetical protein
MVNCEAHTLTEIIIRGGREQLSVRDPRRRSLIPVGHGGHRPVDLRAVQSIGVDARSLMLAQAIEILDPVLARFHPVQILHHTQQSGGASIIPCALEDGESEVNVQLLKELMADVRNLQAVWIDDRFLSGLPVVTDPSGCERPLANIVDVILELQRSEKLSAQASVEALLALRRRGFYVFPITEQELAAALRAARTIKPGGDLAETPDLATLRQYVSRLQGSRFLKLPAENLFLDSLRDVCHQTLLSIWQDAQRSDDLVRTHSDWVLRNLYPASADWRHVLAPPESVDWNERVAREFSVLIAIGSAAGARLETFREWLAETLARCEGDSPGLTRALAAYLAPTVEAILSGDISCE